jgi:hypothetical protein
VRQIKSKRRQEDSVQPSFGRCGVFGHAQAVRKTRVDEADEDSAVIAVEATSTEEDEPELSDVLHGTNASRDRLLSSVNRNLALEMVRVTESAAVAAARWLGKGDKIAADAAAVRAMRAKLKEVDFEGVVVVGEGAKDQAPMLFPGERVGQRRRPARGHRRGPPGRHVLDRGREGGRDRRDRDRRARRHVRPGPGRLLRRQNRRGARMRRQSEPLFFADGERARHSQGEEQGGLKT